MKEPLISIGILNYNGLKYLKKTIPPILKLNYPNYEIIVVDNNSTDGSIKYLRKFKKIRVIKNKENLGYSKGKNICVKNCKGKYVLLLDGDILIKEKDYLEKILKEYNKLTKIAFLSPLMIDKNKNDTKYYGIYYSFYGMNVHRRLVNYNKILKSKEKIKIGSFNGGAVFFKKNFWEILGGYDESQPIMLDDFDISAKAYIKGYKNYLYNKMLVVHLGKERDSNKKYFAWKFKYYFSGISAMIFKDYNIKNLILRFPIFVATSVLMSFAITFKKKNIYIIPSFIYSYIFFLSNINKILKQRKKIQSKRVIKEDIFLKIKPPKFD